MNSVPLSYRSPGAVACLDGETEASVPPSPLESHIFTCISATTTLLTQALGQNSYAYNSLASRKTTDGSPCISITLKTSTPTLAVSPAFTAAAAPTPAQFRLVQQNVIMEKAYTVAKSSYLSTIPPEPISLTNSELGCTSSTLYDRHNDLDDDRTLTAPTFCSSSADLSPSPRIAKSTTGRINTRNPEQRTAKIADLTNKLSNSNGNSLLTPSGYILNYPVDPHYSFRPSLSLPANVDPALLKGTQPPTSYPLVVLPRLLCLLQYIPRSSSPLLHSQLPLLASLYTFLSGLINFGVLQSNLANYTKFVGQHLLNPVCKFHLKEEEERRKLDELLAVEGEDELRMIFRIEEAGYRERWPQRWGCLIFPDDFMVKREQRGVVAEGGT